MQKNLNFGKAFVILVIMFCYKLEASFFWGVHFPQPSEKSSVEDVKAWVSEKREEACKKVTRLQCAKELVQIGKIALVPKALHVAADVFDESLTYDPKNEEAEFYSALLNPVREMKGLLGKMRNLFSSKREYYEFINNFDDIKNFNIKDFLIGKNEITWDRYSQAQDHIYDRVLPRLNASRIRLKFLLNNADLNSKFEYSAWTKVNNKESILDKLISFGNSSSKQYIIIDNAEVMAAIAHIEGLIALASAFVAYNIDDMKQINEELVAFDYNKMYPNKMYLAFGDYPEKIQTNIYKQHKRFLTLRHGDALKHLIVLGKESLGNMSTLVRHFLDVKVESKIDDATSNGLVIKDKFLYSILQTLFDLEPYIEGPAFVSFSRKHFNKSPVKVLVDFTSFLQNPVRDLKTLLPDKFDRDGYALSYPDYTFGGIFPNGDFVDAHPSDSMFRFSIFSFL